MSPLTAVYVAGIVSVVSFMCLVYRRGVRLSSVLFRFVCDICCRQIYVKGLTM